MGTVRLPDTILADLEAKGRVPKGTATTPPPAHRRRAPVEDWPGALAHQARLAGLAIPERELRFHPERHWRFDLAWPVIRVAVEVDGGGFQQRPCPHCRKPVPMGGRHSTGEGLRDDAEKLSNAAAMGWRVLRVVPDQIRSGQALDWLTTALLGGPPWPEVPLPHGTRRREGTTM